MKVIRIKHCLDCPHLYMITNTEIECRLIGKSKKEFGTIPSDCPLEDDTPPTPTETVKEILTVATDPNRKWEGMGKKKEKP